MTGSSPSDPADRPADAAAVDALGDHLGALAGGDGELTTEAGCVLVATALDPAGDPAAVPAHLDAIAARVAGEGLGGLCEHLFTVEGFAGDTEDYRGAANALIGRVIARRRGIPLTLVAVLVAVGNRVGVPLLPVGMPGHVLARHAEDPDVFVDAYAGGVILDHAGSQRVFEALHGPATPFAPAYLAPSTPAEMVARLLANLRATYIRDEDHRRLVVVLRLLSHLPGIGGSVRRDLSTALARVGRFDEAATELETAAEDLTDEDADELGRRAHRLRARLN